MVVIIVILSALGIFACVTGGIVLLQFLTKEKATDDTVTAKEDDYSTLSQEVNSPETEVMALNIQKESVAFLDSAMASLDDQVKNLEKTIKNMDMLIDNNKKHITLKYPEYSSPSTSSVIIKNIIFNAEGQTNVSGKIGINDQKVQVPSQKIEIPKQPNVPPVAKEPPQKIDLSRKIELDVE